MYKQFFSDDDVQWIETEVKLKFGIDEEFRLETPKKHMLDDIIFSLRKQETTTKVATKKLTAVLSDDENDETDMLLLGVRNLIESLPRSKFNGTLRESYLSCSYVHCVLNPIFTSPENKKHLIW